MKQSRKNDSNQKNEYFLPPKHLSRDEHSKDLQNNEELQEKNYFP